MKRSRIPPTPPLYPGPAWRSQPWTGPPSSPLARLRRLILRRRRLFASLLLCAAAAIAVQQLTPTSPSTTSVMVASRDLPAGHVLSSGDLAIAALSPKMVPDGALAAPNA
ncbi:SAF domain-containing protein, partial [Arthrobacter sp.]|uniref:SAF domain-containing protein n=1 Tax=Arthrobacter sp. TaxID=1667 RepID=UPI0034E849CF